MNKTTLSNLFSDAIYRIPDYQRGYAWEERQWKDFVQDIDALASDEVASHYTGTVVVYSPRGAKTQPYGSTKHLRVQDVVDGQQRLTTSCLYLSAILNTLIRLGQTAYKIEIPNYLYVGGNCKLQLSSEVQDIFFNLLKSGQPLAPPASPHARRLIDARKFFQEHLGAQLKSRGKDGVVYLEGLFQAITGKLSFTKYEIEEECDIGMTFELMNSRGKSLSVLELLKNYLMHWVARNKGDANEGDDLTTVINRNWKTVYTNLGTCDGDEDQCLRVAWTLYCNRNPASWEGYAGFKRDAYIPLRTFSENRKKSDVRDFMCRFAEGLAEISSHYAEVVNPQESTALFREEWSWLSKINRAGNVANFLPLIIAARKHCHSGLVSEASYLALLKSLERYSYRVFLFDGRRSNAGKSSLYRWGAELFDRKRPEDEIVSLVYGLIRYYATEESFDNWNREPSNWYAHRRLLKYTLYEYELHLLTVDGKNRAPRLAWEQLSDATIEHILPQTPNPDSLWRATWSQDEFKECLHDLGNLVLTHDNASYSNFEFLRKKGDPGVSPSYYNSDIRQERRLTNFAAWTRVEFMQRRKELIAWVSERWQIEAKAQIPAPDEIDDDADDV